MGENSQYEGTLRFHGEKHNSHRGQEMNPKEFTLEIKHRPSAVRTINHWEKNWKGQIFHNFLIMFPVQV